MSRSSVVLLALLVLLVSLPVAANDVQAIVQENLTLSSQLINEGRYDEAWELLKTNQRLDPDNFMHYRAEAILLHRYMWEVVDAQGGGEVASQYYHQAVQAYRRGIGVAFDAGQPDIVISALHFELADMAYYAGDVETAKLEVSRSLLLHPAARNNNLAGVILLDELERSGENEDVRRQMLEFFENAIRENVQYGHPIFEAYYFTAEAKIESGDYRVAQELIDELRRVAEETGNADYIAPFVTELEALLHRTRR